MVVGFWLMDALYCRSVTNRPAVIPPSGTSQLASESRTREGLVQICFWSFAKSVMCPKKPLCIESSDATYRLIGRSARSFGSELIVFAEGVGTGSRSDGS